MQETRTKERAGVSKAKRKRLLAPCLGPGSGVGCFLQAGVIGQGNQEKAISESG